MRTLALILLLFIYLNEGYSKDVNKENQYEIEIAEIGMPGTLVVRTWCFNKKPNLEDDKFLENAIKGVLFEGIKDSGRMKGRQPLVTEGYNSHKEYFDEFFMKGLYRNYARIALDGYVQQNNLIKVGKQYKIAKIVVVSYNELRNRLENDHIIRGLSNGF